MDLARALPPFRPVPLASAADPRSRHWQYRSSTWRAGRDRGSGCASALLAWCEYAGSAVPFLAGVSFALFKGAHYPRLVRMDNRFRAHLLRAFKRGQESRAAAAQHVATPRWSNHQARHQAPPVSAAASWLAASSPAFRPCAPRACGRIRSTADAPDRSCVTLTCCRRPPSVPCGTSEVIKPTAHSSASKEMLRLRCSSAMRGSDRRRTQYAPA